MAYTGGALNELNGKMGISAPHKSVPVMKLIRVHQPKSKEELVELIQSHYDNRCSCGIISQGSVASFGKNLYHSQFTYWKAYRFTLQECIQWEYDLFVVQSLKGGIVEKKAQSQLSLLLPQCIIEEAEGYLDEELRIDLIIKNKSEVIGGIQVKPVTFLKMRREVILFNQDANRRWGKPVLYLYYDQHEKFENLEDIVSAILYLT